MPNTPDRFGSDGIRVTKDEAAFLFVHHLSLAITFWEIGAEETTAIDNAAKSLTHDSYRRAIFELMAILDSIWKEME